MNSDYLEIKDLQENNVIKYYSPNLQEKSYLLIKVQENRSFLERWYKIMYKIS